MLMNFLLICDMLKSALASDKVKSFCCSFLWNNLDVPHPSLRLFLIVEQLRGGARLNLCNRNDTV